MQILTKRKYLCLSDYDEQYYDFSCLNKLPSEGAVWYTVCGVPYVNRVEYIAMESLICLVAGTVYWNYHFRSAPDIPATQKKKNQ